jgi:putative nucleotidyltransferase with HDIG domain
MAAENIEQQNCELLMVEDSPTQALKLRMLLEENGYPYRIAQDGEAGLALAKEKKPDCIISDVQMPKMDGFTLCRSIKADPALADVPVILLTTLKDVDDIIMGLNVGADSYVTKPYEWPFLKSKIDYHLAKSVERTGEKEIRLDFSFKDKVHSLACSPQRMLTLLLSVYEDSILKNEKLIETQEKLELLNQTLEDKVEERTEKLASEVEERKAREKDLVENSKRLQRATRGSIQAMVALMGLHDPQKAAHQIRTAKLAQALAVELGLSRRVVDGVKMAAIIHDIGQMAVPPEILNAPRKLTQAEYDEVKSHAEAGYDILKNVEFPWPLAQVVLQHHERMDGSGYPNGIGADQLFLESRILGLADVVEAMLSPRPYRDPLDTGEVVAYISQNRATQFDPAVVDACVRLLEEGFSFD